MFNLCSNRLLEEISKKVLTPPNLKTLNNTVIIYTLLPALGLCSKRLLGASTKINQDSLANKFENNPIDNLNQNLKNELMRAWEGIDNHLVVQLRYIDVTSIPFTLNSFVNGHSLVKEFSIFKASLPISERNLKLFNPFQISRLLYSYSRVNMPNKKEIFSFTEKALLQF